MRFPRILSSVVFATIVILTAFASGHNYSLDVDCTPQGTHLNDTTTGGEICSGSASGDPAEGPLSKTGNWNISWPDGHFDGLTATGSGKCTYQWPCGPNPYYDWAHCWPEFHQPITTSAGVFSILVVNKITAPEIRDCPSFPLLTKRVVFCNTNGQTTFSRDNPDGCNLPQNEEDCNNMNWFWNPFSDTCQEDAPPECNLLPELCENGQWSFEWCGCVGYPTPIVVDLNGNGFNLTDANHGVTFNANTVGGKEKLAWTSASSDDAWLVLDRNGNGAIDDGTELFGDATAQRDPPAGEKKNGFLALADYDKLSNGGNTNGQIESGDSVFSSLRLWQDTNHDGLSQPGELHTLPSKNVAAIELDYKLSKKTDNNGNQFSFRAKVKSSNGQQLGRWAWDVYLLRSL